MYTPCHTVYSHPAATSHPSATVTRRLPRTQPSRCRDYKCNKHQPAPTFRLAHGHDQRAAALVSDARRQRRAAAVAHDHRHISAKLQLWVRDCLMIRENDTLP